jgi:C-terminal processing protease CtpA/Prc
MITKNVSVTASIVLSTMVAVLCHIAGGIDDAMAAEEQNMSETSTPHPLADAAKLPDGVIGLSLDMGAERIGHPTSLYVAHVHPEGPARQAGLKHGDEVVTVNGEGVNGKTYEQVIKMIRGTPGTAVKLGLKGDTVREITMTRIPAEQLSMKAKGSHSEGREKKQEVP